jgi:pimeloyl-ACP methyl ester carboxylesterase
MLQRPDGKYISKCDPAPRRLGLLAGRRPQDNLALDELGALNLPVLVVRGEHSNILAADAAERFRDALPRGRLATVPACGHGVPSQNTPGFLAALEDFLATV